jgi:hypothetical protein
MSDPGIREYAKEKAFHPQTLARWLAWEQPDRNALYRLALPLKIGENHLRDLMDWLEEISLRDGLQVRQILGNGAIAALESDPRLGRADKLKRIKEQVRRLRFPRLAQTEDSIRARIQELKLQPEIRLIVPAGLEGGRLRIEFDAASQDELERLIEKLADATGKDAVREIFALLAGSASDDQ